MTEPTNNGALGLVLKEINSFRIEINQRLDRLVTTEAFAAEQRRVDERFREQSKDAEAEVTARKEADAEIRLGLARTAGLVKWAFASIVLPCAALVATIFLAMKGAS